MPSRAQIGLKLFISSAVFLGLTIVTAVCVRNASAPTGRGPASLETSAVFEHRGDLGASELGLLGSTFLARGRRVVFHESIFRSDVSHGGPVSVNLFPDLVVQVQFQNASMYKVNEPLFVGQVIGDDDSDVRFMIVGGVLDGTIRTKGREFRVIDGAGGVHFVTEAKQH